MSSRDAGSQHDRSQRTRRGWRGWRAPLLTALVVAVVVHLAVVVAAPRLVMTVAGNRIADQAGGDNRWIHAPRPDASNQQVVRTSPDLAYSACHWDLADGPVLLTAPPGPAPFSLALYDGRSDNFFVLDHREHPEGGSVLLGTAEQLAGASAPKGAQPVTAPGTSGVALLRYLAPTQETFDEADTARRDAVCGPA